MDYEIALEKLFHISAASLVCSGFLPTSHPIVNMSEIKPLYLGKITALPFFLPLDYSHISL